MVLTVKDCVSTYVPYAHKFSQNVNLQVHKLAQICKNKNIKIPTRALL